MGKQETETTLKTGETNWILLRIEREKSAQGDAVKESNANAPAIHLFEYAQHSSFAERFPRLTFFAIACGLLAFALVAEIDCLRGSGYFWR
ncbi:MAG TPA: hypothetical protein VGF82_14280 [Terracidiphilus sp.]|jgi:hypothetical protein